VFFDALRVFLFPLFFLNFLFLKLQFLRVKMYVLDCWRMPRYEHTQRGQLADAFRFDVGCGGTARRRGLEFGVDVVSSAIALEVAGNLTVAHGGSAALTSNLLRVGTAQLQLEVLVRRQFLSPDCL